MKRVHLDFETRSRIDLTSVGTYIYSKDPSTSIMCMAYANGDEEVGLLEPYFSSVDWEDYRNHELYELAADPDAIFIAHNAFFEQNIWHHIMHERYGWPAIPLERWRCTLAKASALGLPKGLEKLAEVLNLGIEKDMEGRRLMLKYTKPRNKSKHNKNEFFNDDKELTKIFAYCMKDVLVEREIDNYLPDLSPLEQRIWFLDQKINHRGVPIDRQAVFKAKEMLEIHHARLLEKLFDLTEGRVKSVKQVAALKKFLAVSYGVNMPDLRKETVSSYIEKKSIPDDAIDLLRIRQELSQSSTAKVEAIINMLSADDRVRETVAYCSAGTGRWGGRGIQIQNLPRGTVNSDTVIELLKMSDYEFFEFCYPDVFGAISSGIRGLIATK